MPDRFGLVLIGNKLSELDIVPERRRSAHPHALFLASRDFVPNTLTHDLPLKLREGKQHVEGQASKENRFVCA